MHDRREALDPKEPRKEVITMFEITAYLATAECIDCGKDRECLHTTCKARTFDGPLCVKCLFKESRKRSRMKQAQPPIPVSNCQ